ncbi:SusD/RagB family nutrient-binding outer membrane lipoprotein [uncultured Polaribacter sp.]|uniref:SusD/RagB family nutrient-binding outer membrane lipoprotein n=1 Tax=uncultured Polaribacter sp. TaxID=174711 RepID=UPI002606851F|nr:SusD/RagB family nutrient-binding outer membrane lipoprotein [uncultured Polaribacter sp.]
MKNLDIKKYTLFLVVFLFLFTGCENKFDEINTDPNAFSEVPTHFFLAGSILSIANAENHYFDGYLYPSLWIQHTTLGSWDQPGSYFYEDGRSFLWNGLYRGPLTDLDLMVSLAEEEGNTSLQAIGTILHAYSFTLLVNAFGDLPYTESFKVDEGINQPVYDPQSDVFDAILENLRQASNLLNGMSNIDVDSTYDLIYQGDAEKWQKFANSLRFRLLIQLSDIRDVSSELSSISPMFESASDNATYTYSGSVNGNIYPPSTAIGPDGTDPGHRMAAPLINRMNTTDDPRRPIYAKVNDDGMYVGADTQDVFGNGNEFSPINSDSFTRDATIIFMDYSELLFLKAEAAQKGLTTGNEIALLRDAVIAHMQRVGVSAADTELYADNLVANGTNLDEIYTEKWVSMFGRAMQAWGDYRRTGVPSLLPNPNGIINVIPRRFTYPENEQSTNNANRTEAAQKLSNGDALDSPLIWTQN